MAWSYGQAQKVLLGSLRGKVLCDAKLFLPVTLPTPMTFLSWFSRVLLLCLLAWLCSCSGTTHSTATAPVSATATLPSQWVVAWGASSQNAQASSSNPGGSEQSFRFLVLPSLGATEERVHFSNQFGTTPITIGAARLAVALSGSGAAVDPTRDAGLTFGGSSTVTLAAGQEVDSDPVEITYTFGQWLAVSMYVQGSFPPLTEHTSQISNNYASAAGAGNTTADATGASFSQTNQEWYLLSAVEAYGPYAGTVAFFGSSTVDGHNANFGNSNAYPVANVADPSLINDRPTDWLARSLQAANIQLGVLNAGLLGDPAAEDAMTASGSALAGVDRFRHDVLQQPGIKAVVIYIGGIDLRTDCVEASAVEASLINLVAQAYAAGVRVVLGTIPPSEYCQSSGPQPTGAAPYNGDLYPGPENNGSTERRAVNAWVRTTGAQLPGVAAIADFDQALAYPEHPDFLLPQLYSNDNFHPNAIGYGVQNSAIPFSQLLGP